MKEYTLVKFDWTNLGKEWRSKYPEEFSLSTLLYMSEISNMPGHCVVAGRSGKLYIGYHTDQFIELAEDEI